MNNRKARALRKLRAWGLALSAASLVGGVLISTNVAHADPPNSNEASSWSDEGPHDDADCYKHEGNDIDNNAHGGLSDDGKSVILNVFDQNWPGDHWELLVVKAGSGEGSNAIYVHPVAGQAYAAPEGKDVSHWIVCKGTTPDEPTTTTSTTSSTTSTTSSTTTPPPPCEWDPELPADDPDCFPPCEYNPELPADDPECVPPTTTTEPEDDVPLCTTERVVTIDEISDFSATDIRTQGRIEFEDFHAHVWTLDNSGQAKVAGYVPADGWGAVNTLVWTGTSPPPGTQLGLTGGGYLVGEAVYGANLWLSNNAPDSTKALAPHTGGGQGSNWYGTIQEWANALDPEGIEPTVMGFSLGSGVLGDGELTSVTAGCVKMIFKAPPVDICPNLEELQETLPEGYIIVEGECVPVCEYNPEIPEDSEECKPPDTTTTPPTTEPPTVPPTTEPVTNPPTTIGPPTLPPTNPPTLPPGATPAPTIVPVQPDIPGTLPRTGGSGGQGTLGVALILFGLGLGAMIIARDRRKAGINL